MKVLSGVVCSTGGATAGFNNTMGLSKKRKYESFHDNKATQANLASPQSQNDRNVQQRKRSLKRSNFSHFGWDDTDRNQPEATFSPGKNTSLSVIGSVPSYNPTRYLRPETPRRDFYFGFNDNDSPNQSPDSGTETLISDYSKSVQSEGVDWVSKLSNYNATSIKSKESRTTFA